MLTSAPIREPVTIKPHSGGVRGAMMSLDEVAKRAWASRNDPRVRAWTTRVLAAAGSPSTVAGRVQAIVDAYRKAVPYVPDPIKTELMASPVQTLCLDSGGLCIVGGDCDDAAITCGACCMSVGIAIRIVGASYKDTRQPVHVYFEFRDERGDWIPADPTTSYPVGQVVPPAQTWHIDPDKGVGAAGLQGGDFVGIGRSPAVQGLGPEGKAGPQRAPIDDWLGVQRPGELAQGVGTVPSDVYEYHRVWTPYVGGTYRALLTCADNLQKAADALAAGDTQKTTLQLYVDGMRLRADDIDNEWNQFAGTPAWQLLETTPAPNNKIATEILTYLQNVVTTTAGRARADWSSAIVGCPSTTWPTAAPLPTQNAMILALEDAGTVATGTLQLLTIGSTGAIETAGAAVRWAAQQTSNVTSALSTPWPWIALTVVGGALVAIQVWPRR